MVSSILRLTSLRREEGLGRHFGIAIGIAVGVGLLLTLLGAAQGLTDRQERRSWLNVTNDMNFGAETLSTTLTDDSILVLRSTDYVDGRAIDRIDLAVTATTNERTPWGAALPAPDTYYASPALIALIESRPANQLGDRFGTLIGPIPDSALASPDSIVVLAGKAEATLRPYPGAEIRPELAGQAYGANMVHRMVMIIGGISLFLPVLLLISTTTQLGGAERAERLSTFRLIGATPESVMQSAAIEMGALAMIGSTLGAIGWWLLRPVGARFRIDEGRFFPVDLNVPTSTIVLIIVGAVVVSALAAGIRIARMSIGPLGVSRERSEPAPSPLGLAPLAIGLASFGFSTMGWRSSSIDPIIVQFLVIGGFLLTALGIIWAGPWLTNTFSRFTARLSRSAAGVVASGRIRRHPSATFRSVSGLVLAVFVVTVFAGSASSVLERDDPIDGSQVFPTSMVYAYVPETSSESALAAVTTDLETIPGVTAAMVALIDGNDYGAWILPAGKAPFVNVPVADDRPWVAVSEYDYVWGEPDVERSVPTGLATLPTVFPVALLVATDGRDGVIDEVRTRLEHSGATTSFGRTRPDNRDLSSREFINSLATLAYIGIAITILIAGISLTISTAAGMLERKRVFGLLRLMGMPTGVINRIVTFEAVAPLVAVLALTIGLGFLISWFMVEGLSTDRSLHAPDVRYYVAVFGSLGLAVLSVLAVTGLIRRHTELNQTRFE
jgi:ABC-type antimicrobial peptide transport system permease subunit